MFFRRVKPRTLTFEDHLANLRKAGFGVESQGSGSVLASRYGCAAVVVDQGGTPKAATAGLLIGKEIGLLVDGGYQKFFRTPGGLKAPALAQHLRSLHAFQEDLTEALGLVSLYNESLGSTSADHLYDRVKDRDHGVPRRPWEHSA